MLSKRLADKIKFLLTADPKYRDDDTKLLARLWKNQIESRGRRFDSITAQELMVHFVKGELPHFESVRRTRQKLQETDPKLRGKRYEERHKDLEPKIRDEVRNF